MPTRAANSQTNGEQVAIRNDSDNELQSLDFSGDTPSADNVPALQVGGDYDSRPQEDSARRRIAYALIGLLWVIVLGMLVLLGCGSITVSDIKDFGVVLGPVVTLVSAATGFYYGTKSNSTGKK